MADYQSMVGELRAAGIRAEIYLGNPKNFGNQLKYADKRNSPIAMIEGGDEKAERGMVQLKDLILGAKIAETATLEEWKDRPSQIRSAARCDLVAKVQRNAGQSVRWRQKPTFAFRRRRCCARVQMAGAEVVEADMLQPADTLLDLYGEDIRARAYRDVADRAAWRDRCCAPISPCPWCRCTWKAARPRRAMHYMGEVFRKQEHDPDGGPTEYMQVGV